MMKLYQMQDSGNCYKLRLALTQLEHAFELVDIDITRGESRTASYLGKNPNGKVPALEIETGEVLAESNAILWYLANDSVLLPESRLDRARVLQWMFFEQYSHEPFIATSRYWIHILGQPETYAAEIAAKRAGGEQALAVMNQHLATSDFFVANQYSIADIALYAYTHVAHEGNFALHDYPAITRWIERVKDQPRHINMNQRPTP